MSDSNLSEKISDSIANIFKKTKVFEKIDKMQFYIGSFVLISTIYFSGSILNNYLISKKQIDNNNNILYGIEDIKNNCVKTINHDIILLNDKIINLESKLTNLLEFQNMIFNDIHNLPLFNVVKRDMVSTSTSISSFTIESPEKNNESKVLDDGWHLSEKEDTVIKNILNNNDDELSNDCYDSIPLSNVKKITGIKGWLF